ncbi:MAG: type III pantothenate kinase, partial [Planctomycetota bacterium]
IRQIAADELDEEIHVIGEDIPLPMSLWVDEPEKVGTDRIVSAAAAYAVAEDAVVVADFGTAITIDLVDEHGVFLGGVICPGFDISAKALKENTAQLPKAKISKPKAPYGKNTTEAINCGLYYSAVGMLEEVIRRYAEDIGKWPQTVITGAAAKTIKDDCTFIDSYVPSLVVKGIVLAYKKYLSEKTAV